MYTVQFYFIFKKFFLERQMKSYGKHTFRKAVKNMNKYSISAVFMI